MALDTNFNVNPYYDDFDEDKKFLRVLFKPGYAVQARELTQLQTILQKQADRFGNATYKNGSVVTGAETFTQDATYIKLNASYLGTDIVANNFIGMTILSNDESKRAEVVKVYEADLATGDPITLMVKQLYGDTFSPGDVIKTNQTSPDVPAVPDSPDEPAEPDVPDVPSTPLVPEEPEEPDSPLLPSEPDWPLVPDVPAEPEEPKVPFAPLVPFTPDVPLVGALFWYENKPALSTTTYLDKPDVLLTPPTVKPPVICVSPDTIKPLRIMCSFAIF